MVAARWSDLPRDLLRMMGNRLNNRIDILRFRSVCSSWRNSVPPFRKWQLRRFTLPNRRGSLGLVGTTVFRLEPIHNPPNSPPPKAWLIRVSESERPRRDHLLLNPLVHKRIRLLSPLNLNLLEFRVSEICQSYMIDHIDLAGYGALTNIQRQRAVKFGKVLFFSNTHLMTGTSTTTINNSVVVVLQNYNYFASSYLAAIRLGEDEFTPPRYSKSNGYRDIVNFNGQIYAVDTYGNCYTVDSSLNVTLIAPHLDGQVCWKKNLVVSCGELLMVDRFFQRNEYCKAIGASVTEISRGYKMCSWFRVYKLNEEDQKWVEVRNLGDRMLFLGSENCCFSVCAADFGVHNCRGNCIFFIDDDSSMLLDRNFDDQYDALRGRRDKEIGVFNLEDGRVGQLVCFPGYADLFWPPPTWLSPTTSSSSSNPNENDEENADFLGLKIALQFLGSS